MQPTDAIHLISDQAIFELGNARTDSLDFESYADVIARTVRGTRGPFTIGVFGEWGMGKTSLMHMIEQRVESTQTEAAVIVPVWFNAWMFERVEYPIIPLIKAIVEALQARKTMLEKTGNSAKDLIDGLQALSEAIAIKGSLGLPGGTAKVEAEFNPGLFGRAFSHRRAKRRYGVDHTDPYEAMFDAFNAIQKQAVPKHVTILVLIDDLDRCFPENAIRLLESIKLILAQAGFVFILGASRIVIEEYLHAKYEKEYGINHFNGRAYLDKMIQLSFDIPPHNDRVDSFTDQIIDGLEDGSVKQQLAPLANLIGKTCHDNPRTIIRFINRLLTDSAIYKQKNRDVNRQVPLDIFAVTRSLEQTWKDLYGLLISGESFEDREYCSVVAGWSAQDLADWKDYDLANKDPAYKLDSPQVAGRIF